MPASLSRLLILFGIERRFHQLERADRGKPIWSVVMPTVMRYKGGIIGATFQ
jgi:hypothetical protein